MIRWKMIHSDQTALEKKFSEEQEFPGQREEISIPLKRGVWTTHLINEKQGWKNKTSKIHSGGFACFNTAVEAMASYVFFQEHTSRPILVKLETGGKCITKKGYELYEKIKPGRMYNLSAGCRIEIATKLAEGLLPIVETVIPGNTTCREAINIGATVARKLYFPNEKSRNLELVAVKLCDEFTALLQLSLLNSGPSWDSHYNPLATMVRHVISAIHCLIGTYNVTESSVGDCLMSLARVYVNSMHSDKTKEMHRYIIQQLAEGYRASYNYQEIK